MNHLLCASPVSASSVMGRSRSSDLGCERRGLHGVISETALAYAVLSHLKISSTFLWKTLLGRCLVFMVCSYFVCFD